jgi:hypothetical protein
LTVQNLDVVVVDIVVVVVAAAAAAAQVPPPHSPQPKSAVCPQFVPPSPAGN